MSAASVPAATSQGPLSSSFGLIIGGEDVQTASRSSTHSPLESHAHTYPAASPSDALNAVDSASRAFSDWTASTPLERRTIFSRAATLLEERKDEISEAMMAETGAQRGWALFSLEIGRQMIEEGAAMTTSVVGEILPCNNRGTTAYIYREACGVILAIAPWNAPVNLAIRAVMTPLVCGNTVVLKASELSPYTQYLIVDTFRRAGLPPGVLNYVSCPRENVAEITEAIIAHDAVAKVNFTGSTSVGRKIAIMCAKYLKPSLLELGGKSPMIVLEDADLQDACNSAAFGALFHQGQICMSTERIIVQKPASDEFRRLFAAKVASLRAADPRKDASAPLSKLISAEAGVRVRNLVEDALSKGASLAGGQLDVEGATMQPLMLTGVTSDMDIYQQECFGPTVSLFEVDTVDEAVKLANDTELGLNAAVFSRDTGKAMAVARRLKCGSCHINGSTVHDEPHLPHGGVKQSGYGKFGGMPGVDEFTVRKLVTVSNGGHPYPF